MQAPTPYNPLYIPPILTDLEKLASAEDDILSKLKRNGKDPEYALEEKLWQSFRILGFEVKELGHKAAGKRVPDGIALARRAHYAILFDGKMRGEGCYIGTEDRAIVEYIKRFSLTLEGEGIESIYFLIISSRFKGDNQSCILKIRKETSVKNIALLKVGLLLYLIELKLRYPSVTPIELEGIFLRSVEITKEDIDRELREYTK